MKYGLLTIIDCELFTIDVQVNDKHMGALAMRGDAYYEMDEFELAQRHYRQGLKLDPEHKVWWWWWWWVGGGGRWGW